MHTAHKNSKPLLSMKVQRLKAVKFLSRSQRSTLHFAIHYIKTIFEQKKSVDHMWPECTQRKAVSLLDKQTNANVMLPQLTLQHSQKRRFFRGALLKETVLLRTMSSI